MFTDQLLCIVLTVFAGSGLVSQWIPPTTASPAATADNANSFVGGSGGISVGGGGKSSSYYLRDMSVATDANVNITGRKSNCHTIRSDQFNVVNRESSVSFSISVFKPKIVCTRNPYMPDIGFSNTLQTVFACFRKLPLFIFRKSVMFRSDSNQIFQNFEVYCFIALVVKYRLMRSAFL